MAYENAKKLFFTELHNSIQSGKSNPYSEAEMKNTIPETISELGKDTIYSDFIWTSETLLDKDMIFKFLKKLSDQHSGNNKK